MPITVKAVRPGAGSRNAAPDFVPLKYKGKKLGGDTKAGACKPTGCYGKFLFQGGTPHLSVCSNGVASKPFAVKSVADAKAQLAKKCVAPGALRLGRFGSRRAVEAAKRELTDDRSHGDDYTADAARALFPRFSKTGNAAAYRRAVAAEANRTRIKGDLWPGQSGDGVRGKGKLAGFKALDELMCLAPIGHKGALPVDVNVETPAYWQGKAKRGAAGKRGTLLFDRRRWRKVPCPR